MPKMCAIPQLVSAPSKPLPIVQQFKRSYPQCYLTNGKIKKMKKMGEKKTENGSWAGFDRARV